MKAPSLTAGHQNLGGLVVWNFIVLCAITRPAVCPLSAQTTSDSSSTHQIQSPARRSPQQIADLKAKADSGDPSAQWNLGQAYRKGDGVSKNDDVAYKWERKAAEQGNADAENDLGTMFRLGEGVAEDKEEAVRWYQRAATHGHAEGTFNLGTCYYNGDGVGSNEYTAYLWFLVAQDLGSLPAADAVERSAESMSRRDTADAYVKIADMYRKGESLRKDDEQYVRWLRKAAEVDSLGKARLGVYLLTAPEGSRNYAQALDLCKSAAKDYAPALACVGYVYRKGLGVPQDSVEAKKWYEIGAKYSDSLSMTVLAEMYATGEGTKVDRPSAFMLWFRAGRLGASGAKEKAAETLQQMSPVEIKETETKLSGMKFDIKKVLAELQTTLPATK